MKWYRVECKDCAVGNRWRSDIGDLERILERHSGHSVKAWVSENGNWKLVLEYWRQAEPREVVSR